MRSLDCASCQREDSTASALNHCANRRRCGNPLVGGAQSHRRRVFVDSTMSTVARFSDASSVYRRSSRDTWISALLRCLNIPRRSAAPQRERLGRFLATIRPRRYPMRRVLFFLYVPVLLLSSEARAHTCAAPYPTTRSGMGVNVMTDEGHCSLVRTASPTAVARARTPRMTQKLRDLWPGMHSGKHVHRGKLPRAVPGWAHQLQRRLLEPQDRSAELWRLSGRVPERHGLR